MAVRVGLETFNQLQQACYLLKRTQGQIIEESLEEYCRNHSLDVRHQLVVHAGYVVLQRVSSKGADVLEVKLMNGVSPSEMAQQYTVKMSTPVTVIDDTSTGDGGKKADDAPGDQAS